MTQARESANIQLNCESLNNNKSSKNEAKLHGKIKVHHPENEHKPGPRAVHSDRIILINIADIIIMRLSSLLGT